MLLMDSVMERDTRLYSVEPLVNGEKIVYVSEKGEEIRTKFLALNKGSTHEVLLEEYRNGRRKGRTDNYIQVEITTDKDQYQKGEIISYTL